jgi:hypothetical protein
LRSEIRAGVSRKWTSLLDDYIQHQTRRRSPYFFYLLTVGVEVVYFHSITLRHTPQSVGLLWTRDRPVAETSTSQYTALTREKNITAPSGIRTHDPSKHSAAKIKHTDCNYIRHAYRQKESHRVLHWLTLHGALRTEKPQGEKRNRSTLLFTSASDGVGVRATSRRQYTQERDLVPILQEAG